MLTFSILMAAQPLYDLTYNALVAITPLGELLNIIAYGYPY